MNTSIVNSTFDPQTLADDLLEVRRVYAQFFAGLSRADWDRPVKGGSEEWTLHETVAHLLALDMDGLESIKKGLVGEPYIFTGLDSRYKFNAFNRKGIDDHRKLSMEELCGVVLDLLSEAASIACNLTPTQAVLTVQMPIYNRPVKIVEALSIIIFHFGLAHSAQVAEPAGKLPLWTQFSPGFRHRVIERMMRALSLLYRRDIGGALRATIAFRVGGPDGGEWYVDVSPEVTASGEGHADHPSLTIQFREPAVFYQMPTVRLNLPRALLSGDMKLRGDLRLFLRMSKLFSVDARP